MKLHYLAIVNRIRARVPEIKTIDLYNGQYQKMDSENPFLTPAVFVEFSALPWVNQGDGTQEAPEATITLHIVAEDYEDVWQADSADIAASPAMKWIALIEKVHKAFNNYSAQAMYVAPAPAQLPDDAPQGSAAPLPQQVWLSTDWQRSNQEPDTDADHMRVEKLTYSMNLFDYSATDYYDYIQVMAEPEVTAIILP
jgi:hypothetical protein